MPNYRKKKQSSSRNKNKNKNLNQSTSKSTTTTSSASVNQETSEFTSVGISPNLPADVSSSLTTSATAASVLERGNVVVDDSSPSSNEEIDKNSPHNVDIDSCSSDIKTKLTQSNYSPSLNTSSSSTSHKESTEIERQSVRSTSDGDSTIGSSVITDTFNASRGKNSLKTGSAQTKDAAVPTAERSATRSVETTRISDGNKTGVETILDATSLEKSQDSTSTSKVIVNKTFKKKSQKSITSTQPEIVTQTPEVQSSDIIVQQFSKKGSRNSSSGDSASYPILQQEGIVHQKGGSNTTKHVAADETADQLPLKVGKQTSKKKAVRSTTTSLQKSSTQPEKSDQSQSDHATSSTGQQQSSKVVVHQILRDGKPAIEDITTSVIQQQSSKLILHPISKEEELKPQAHPESSKNQSEQQYSKVIVHQISKEDPTQLSSIQPRVESSKIVEHQILRKDTQQSDSLDDHDSILRKSQQTTIAADTKYTTSAKQQSKQTSSKMIVHHEDAPKADIPQKGAGDFAPQKVSKLIIHQISREGSVQEPATAPDKYIEDNAAQHDSTESLLPLQEVTILRETASEQLQKSSKVIVHQILKEESSQLPGSPNEAGTPNSQSELIVHQISKEEDAKSTEKIIEDTLAAPSIDQTAKVVLHQIVHENSTLTTSSPSLHHQNPFDENLQHSRALPLPSPRIPDEPRFPSKVIVHPILQERSTQTESDQIKAENDANTVHSRTAFPVTRSPKMIVRPFQFEAHPKQAFPLTPISMDKLVNSSNTIAHQILKDVSSELQPSNRAIRKKQEVSAARTSPTRTSPTRTSFPVSRNDEGLTRPGFFEASTIEAESNPIHAIEPKVITQRISNEESKSDRIGFPLNAQYTPFAEAINKKGQAQVQKDIQSAVMTHPISWNPSQFSSSSTSSSTFSSKSNDIEPKVIDKSPTTHQPSSYLLLSSKDSDSKVAVDQTLKEESTSTKLKMSSTASASNAMETEQKVIVHQILKEESKLTQSTAPTDEKDQSSSPPSKDTEEKVIVYQISRAESTPKESRAPLDITIAPENSNIKSGRDDLQQKVIVHQISKEAFNSTQSSKSSVTGKEEKNQSSASSSKDAESIVIGHQISLEESNPKQSTSLLDTTTVPENSSSKSNDLQQKVIVHQILKEESNSTQSLALSISSDLTTGGKDKSLPSSLKGTESKVIMHQVSREECTPDQSSSPMDTTIIPVKSAAVQEPLPSDLDTKTIVHQTSEESLSSTSSGGSMLTTIAAPTPDPLSPPAVDSQTDKVIAIEKSSSKEVVCKLNQESVLAEEGQKSTSVTGRVIIHPIVREIISEKNMSYRVESPKPEKRQLIVRKSKSFDDDDMVIQEMSDTSSTYDTDNPPEVSEAESETDTLEAIDEFADTEINSRVLSVQTLPIDHEDNDSGPMSPKTLNDNKVRRQQNRAALQTHFLPQFLSPNFLDSIKEENSDQSDTERRSECSDRNDYATQQGNLEDDVFFDGGPHAKNADAVFPRSNLDFSKKHKHVQTNVRPPKTSVIREEAPPPSVVEAKIVDQKSIEQGCGSWSTNLTPELEAAEVVYIDSASSSVSDLLELDYSQGQPDDSTDVRIQTPTIDLESVNEMFAYRQSEPTQSPPQPPVKEGENTSEQIPSASVRVDTIAQQTIPNEIILEKIETMSATTVEDIAAPNADRSQNSKENISSSCDSAINEVVTNNDTSSVVGHIGKMENLRDIVSASVQSELNTITDPKPDRDVVKPNFMIGEPCSDYALTSTTTSTTSPSSTSATTTTNTTTTETQILTLHDLSKTLDKTKHLHPLISSSSALDRQESFDSHTSDQSQSTNQSQCTAINQGPLPRCDWNENDTSTDTTYISETDTPGPPSSENSSPVTTGYGRSTDDTESPPIRKLRLLCTEALASLPYGEEVLEELATVAQNIGEMPYPLPQLPHIQDIQVSLQSTRPPPKSSSVIHLAQVPPRPIEVGQKLGSPPPPPVPAPPTKYDSWLGVPTESDPSVLVCLSPSQRSAIKDESTPDSLLDMHKKFVERRGYHEYTTKQVSAMNKENTSETVKLSKSSSPAPPPLPPRQQHIPAKETQTQESKSYGGDINTDDQNNHRLLAIIRDTHDIQQQHQQQSSSENISRRTESGTNTSTTNTNSNSGGGHAEFANSPSVSKPTQEQRFASSESNTSQQSAHHEMQSQKSEPESVLGLRFPTSDYFDGIFNGSNKRFSNIETTSSPGFCSQILSTQPKRYSNIETSSFESRKCVENGKVLYDVTDSNRQTVREGEKTHTSFPEAKPSANGFSSKSSMTTNQPTDSRTPISGDSENIMSAFKLNTQTTAPPPPRPAPVNRTDTSASAPPVPPLPTTAIDTNATTTSKSTSTTSSESVINRTFSGETKEKIFDDFGQRAKEAATATGTPKSTVFDHEKLFKDFDALSNLLKDELESGKRRPPATLDDVPPSVRDYNRVAKESKIQNSHVSSTTTTTETSRREQMKLLADEIDRTAQQRQQRKEMRIPINIEKPTPTTSPRRSTSVVTQFGEIPVRNVAGKLHPQRGFEVPVHMDPGTHQRTYSEHQPSQRSHEAPVQATKPPAQPARFRRAESMFNISDSLSSRHMNHDDWMKCVGELGSSENICKPFQREVEICYLGRRPNIRAPRMSASTSDLSSNHSYDTYGAYDVRRTNNQTPRPQQPPPRRYLSTQSMVDTTPITACVSPHRSPVSERKRRSSLPQEIAEQQWKYISSKEHQLQIEFERLENERRQLVDEMNRAQINQRMNREAYRQRQLPPLTEDESFRQQMAEEWLGKVAEREERRLQKIIKISKINQDANLPAAPPRRVSSSDIGDEFLSRVKERRSKLHMPSDSDWESGAESQPIPHTDGSRSENEEPPIRVLDGQAEASLGQLPKHLREFAKLASQVKEDHHEETNESSSCSATKKSSIVTTVKTSNNNTNTNNFQEYQQQQQLDADRARDLPQCKRQKLVTILCHKNPAESGSSVGGCQTLVTTGATTAGTSANSAKRRKQTRFLLTPNRRSWSESDLLREIDKDLVLAKGFLYSNVYSVKNEYMSEPETEYDKPKKMAQLSRRQYDGIGPTTQHGMPVVLRSEVKEPNQHEWYKRIFQTIHKQKNPDDYVTIRYKCPRERYPYKSNGYMSEPEPNYDSDYSTVKYRTLERRRLQSTGTGPSAPASEAIKRPSTGAGNDIQVDTVYGTMPNPVKSSQGSYKNQPGRIENYITGHSSVSDKEKKEWWDEVMDIFNGQFDQQKLSPHYTEGNLSRALLKEQGYTSDSNLVFRKKDVPQHQSPLSPVEQKHFYKSVQAGGQPPLLGFRKPAPEKPKDSDEAPPIPPMPPTKGVAFDLNGFNNLESPNRYFESDVNIHYKTPIRYEYKDPIPEEELAIRQAESMQKLYQEERRRKYLQELQDMNSRRHTDNFTATQKSPIPLNRYDDFNSDLAPKSPNNSSNYPRTIARALYNFQGQTARELTFKKGDVIYIRRQIDKNWYEGEHNAMIGLLPSNYVELITKDGVRQPPKKPSEGQARAKYNFQAQSGIELSIKKGEHVTLTRRVDDNWFEGKIANRKGIFPVSYVEVLVDIGVEDKQARQQPASQSTITQSSSMRPSLDTLRTNINNEFNSLTSNGQQPPNGILRDTKSLHKTEVLHVDTNTEPVAYRALYKYRPQNTDELELQEGDIVYVLEKCDDGWFVGTSQRNGCFGTFPGNYVERV